MTSVTFEFWKDTGYTESGVERPPIGSVLPHPDMVYAGERPNRGDMFSKVSVKGDYADLMSVSYLRATYDLNGSDDIVIYGWVDSVTLRSDTEDYAMCDIRWHPDLWRTWSSKAEFRAGTVRRRPSTSDIPPQPYPYRYWRATRTYNLHQSSLWWVMVNYVSEDESHQWTYITHACIPVRPDVFEAVKVASIAGGTARDTLALTNIARGELDEVYGIPPSSIIAVAVSPVPPFDYEGAGTYDDPLHPVAGEGGSWYVEDKNGYGLFQAGGGAVDNYHEFSSTLSSTVRADDTERYMVRTVDGSVIGSLPWGIPVKGYTYRLIDAIGSFYVQIRFNGVDSYSEGLCFTAPLPTMSITQNSWAEYTYSGQREYDIQTRNLQSLENLQRGLTSSLSGAGEQTGLSTMFGGMNTLKGKTMVKGGAITAGASAIGTGVNYAMDMVYFNGEYQRWEDYASARQVDNIILPGDGTDYCFHGCPLSMVRLSSDDYSKEQRASDIELYGAHVTEPRESCQSIIRAGGPLQITNLTVGGDIPVEAKEYIRMMFSNGVRLV